MTKTQYRRYMTTGLLTVASVGMFIPWLADGAYIAYIGLASAIIMASLITKPEEPK